jgi:hypothetical protein
MRGTTVRTPDGHVWTVRRRWARRDTALRRYLARRSASRRIQSIRRDKQPDLEATGPNLESWIFEMRMAQDIVAVLGAVVILVAATGLGFLGWLVVTAVRPSIPHPALVLSVLATAIVAVAVGVLINRPWLVEAERLGIDPPRRVWRARGWRRSGRVLREVVAAIGQGRLDVRPSGAVPENPRPPVPPTG